MGGFSADAGQKLKFAVIANEPQNILAQSLCICSDNVMTTPII